jgi:hypothetical protein
MFVMRKKFGLGQVCGSAGDGDAAGRANRFDRDLRRTDAGKENGNPRPSNKIDHYYEPLPQETGTAGLKLMLRRLQTTARLMQVDAHPDDEDGGMLTLEARGQRRLDVADDAEPRRRRTEQTRQQSVRRAGRVADAGSAGSRPLLRRGAAVLARRGFRVFENSRRNLSEMARA